jgi:hypothetical protein
MKKDRYKTKVKFLIEKENIIEGKDIGGDVFAFFPEERESDEEGLFTSYAHVGQHSGCHVNYAKECKEANYNEYQDLLKELIDLGYNLEIVNKQKVECRRNPTEFEIKFGNGATHFRDFKLGQLVKRNGDLKSWFIAPDDKLRYSRV